MKALVTGGSGFVGRHLVASLLRKGYEVVVLTRSFDCAASFKGKMISLHVGDLTDIESLKTLPLDFDYVFHLAAVRDSSRESQCVRTNYHGTRNLLEVLCSRKCKPKKFIYVSSIGAVGLSNDEKPINESSMINPVSYYGKSKMAAENITRKHKNEIPFLIFRPSKIYGPGDKKIVFHFRFVRFGFYPKLGIHPRYLSLSYVEDLVEAMVLAAESKVLNETYLFSDGNIYSWEEFYRAIARAMNKKAHRIFIPEATVLLFPLLFKIFNRLFLKSIYVEPTTIIELNSRYWICNPSKFFSDFSFKPRFLIDDGIKRTLEWFNESNTKKEHEYTCANI